MWTPLVEMGTSLATSKVLITFADSCATLVMVPKSCRALCHILCDINVWFEQSGAKMAPSLGIGSFFSFLSRKPFLWDVTSFLEARRHLQDGYSENSHVLSKKCSKNMKILVIGIFFYDFSKKYWEIVQTCEYRWLNRRKSGVPRLRVWQRLCRISSDDN